MYSREERTRLTGEMNYMSACRTLLPKIVTREDLQGLAIISSQEKWGCALIRACSVITSNMVCLMPSLCYLKLKLISSLLVLADAFTRGLEST